MGKKKPWSIRVGSGQLKPTVDEGDTWKHVPLMYWAGWLCLVSCISAFIVVFVNVFFAVRKLISPSGDPNEPGILEVALPVVGIGVGVCAVTFMLGLFILQWQRQKMKQHLLPARCHRCPKCFYDLSNRPRNDDTCPECGVVAPRRECVRLWCKLLRTRF